MSCDCASGEAERFDDVCGLACSPVVPLQLEKLTDSGAFLLQRKAACGKVRWVPSVGWSLLEGGRERERERENRRNAGSGRAVCAGGLPPIPKERKRASPDFENRPDASTSSKAHRPES